MQNWRILKLETHDAFMNMAIDESILRSRVADSVPNTLRFYRWKPSAVSIGRFQKLENEVILENCRKLGVDVVRRMSGGGAVFHDEIGEITYSVIAAATDLGATEIAGVYSKIYAAVSEALRIIGIVSDYSPGDFKNCPNLTVNAKKISGSAQANKGGVVLQHGTLLMSVDLPKMFKVLKVPWATSCMQVVNVAKGKITSVQNELGHSLTPETVVNALAHGFAVTLNMNVVENVQSLQDQLTNEERKIARQFYNDKYFTKEWNFEAKTAVD